MIRLIQSKFFALTFPATVFATPFLITMAALVSCATDETREGGDEKKPLPVPKHWLLSWIDGLTPGDILVAVATVAAGIAAIGLIVGPIICLWLGMRKTATAVAGTCAAVLLFAPILIYIGHHLWLIALCAAGLGAIAVAVYVWKNIEAIEERLNMDINRDGKIGDGIP